MHIVADYEPRPDGRQRARAKTLHIRCKRDFDT